MEKSCRYPYLTTRRKFPSVTHTSWKQRKLIPLLACLEEFHQHLLFCKISHLCVTFQFIEFQSIMFSTIFIILFISVNGVITKKLEIYLEIAVSQDQHYLKIIDSFIDSLQFFHKIFTFVSSYVQWNSQNKWKNIKMKSVFKIGPYFFIANNRVDLIFTRRFSANDLFYLIFNTLVVLQSYIT